MDVASVHIASESSQYIHGKALRDYVNKFHNRIQSSTKVVTSAQSPVENRGLPFLKFSQLEIIYTNDTEPKQTRSRQL